ncbi:matrixin family metalloprotease [Cyanobacterium aponinum UTEX 3222]|nr:matrixin family metalloprotease [Cyanobacterium aponinum]WPF90051.1 matrixin family metalloprotease [Cyanobacterium aponinum AL20115]WRL41841.1 matrixin family metalloprotease [Cyanobacterium aponinum UTEX 3222]
MLSPTIRFLTKVVFPLFLITFIGFIFAIPSISQEAESSLPPFKTYPLPQTLQNWHSDNQENYFSQLDTHPAGALIWTDFPVKVYIQSPAEDDLSPSALQSFQQWQKAVKDAIAPWQEYIEIRQIDNADIADIVITRQPPAIKAEINPETGLYDLPRNRAATTSVRFYLTEDNPPLLKHKMAIAVNPNQIFEYLVSNISHEMGHALGIWGHSDNPQDIMYYAHTREIPQISPRDINTLKKVYQQPTRLGNYLTSVRFKNIGKG